LIKNQGVDTWHLVYERRQSLAEFEKTKKEKLTKMDVGDLLKFLAVEFEARLAFDELKCQVILDGRVLSLTDELRCWLCEKYKIKTTKEALNDALTYQARKSSFHPVRQYLEMVERTVEFEKISSKRAAGEIKAFLARRSDCFRKPYGREAQDHARMFVLCGSVNKLGFLLDETGNRRFWIIPVGDGIEKIDINLLAQERDAIWASAVIAYRSGEQWWLTDQEQYLSSENNERFELMDEWQVEVETYIKSYETVSIKEILERQFEILPAQQDKASQIDRDLRSGERRK
jgi:predicted P-loop ATPase